jgi:hypothetical protein
MAASELERKGQDAYLFDRRRVRQTLVSRAASARCRAQKGGTRKPALHQQATATVPRASHRIPTGRFLRCQPPLRAAVASARLVRHSDWRGRLLDGAALAAQELGRSDLSKRLESAWGAAPTLARVLRWLAAGDARGESLRNRAAKALSACPKAPARQLGLLRVLLDDIPAAAAALASAPVSAGRIPIIPDTRCSRCSPCCCRAGRRS